MRRGLLLSIVLASSCLLSGCFSQAEKPDANYSAYLDLVKAQQTEQETIRNAFAAMAAKCTSDACVSQVAAILGLTISNGSRGTPPQQFVPHESYAGKIGLALVGQLSPLAAAAVSWHNADTSKDVSLAQYSFLGGAVHDVTSTAASVAPTITVGRDYITGSVDNGTHVSGDLTNGNKTTTTTSIENSGVYNTGTIDRYQSPSDDHSASGTGCTGSTTCQTQPAPTPPAPATP